MDTINSVIAALDNAPGLVVPLVRAVPIDLLKRRPAPQVWSAHEHACHLAQVHPLFFARLDLMLHDDHPVIKPYFPDVDDADDALLHVDLNEALTRFVDERRTLVARLKTLAAGDWQRTAEHGEYNQYSIFIMFRHLALHDLTHAYYIEELLLKKDWA